MSILESGWFAAALRWTGPDTHGDDMMPHNAMQSALDEGFGPVVSASEIQDLSPHSHSNM